ncbi:hypothetical protein AB205_0208560 [Aquarana catesbeiana]|uniref:Uncharacterized protein n=1 Tax=Aquarana catesbeiana TaxID=8400 RepID=A0A2G9RMB2_AQUCT|nr:hypothetical protein AB205_0208560 [Aquarana catesbeiana]
MLSGILGSLILAPRRLGEARNTPTPTGGEPGSAKKNRKIKVSYLPRISNLTKSLHVRSQRKSHKRPSKNMDVKKQPIRPTGRTSKAQRRRQTGKTGRNRE